MGRGTACAQLNQKIWSCGLAFASSTARAALKGWRACLHRQAGCPPMSVAMASSAGRFRGSYLYIYALQKLTALVVYPSFCREE